ncbi:MAG: carboxylesterase family protein [Acidobacteria bacterium]|nr:carboxylesterase family protein [Acidobacteriota bacterium]
MALILLSSPASAQVPPEVAQQLREIGPVVDPPRTALIYRPLQSRDMTGVKVVRDQRYGWHERHVLDVFAPADEAGVPRPVLIYVAGGGGNKIEQVPSGEAFYDNIMLWAVKNGMTGVNVQRLGGQGRAWDDPARDIGMVIHWIRQNIAMYRGNPDRVFIWAHSAGTGPTSAYIAHAHTHGPAGVGLKGAVLMGGNINIAPVVVNVPQGQGRGGRGDGAGAGRGDGAGRGAGDGGRGRGAVDPATQLARSNLPGLRATSVTLFFGAGEVDTPGAVAFVNTARTEICRGKATCQAVIFKDHSHMSSVFSPNTEDDSVTAPILKWMRSIR